MRLNVITALLVVAATVPAVAQQSARRSAWRDIQGFNIVLVIGENDRISGVSMELPGAARRALADMREFLPYKHYRVLDSQWTSCCSAESIRLGLPISGRLQGLAIRGAATRTLSNATRTDVTLAPSTYIFALTLSEASDGRLPVRFALRLEEPSSRSAAGAEGAQLESRVAGMREQLEAAELQLREARQRHEVGLLPPGELRKLEGRHAQQQRRLAEAVKDLSAHGNSGGRPIIDSSFTMDVGETVVVGTSRLGGERALIALVTAVRRSSSR